jgi:hypothetical protein
LATWKLKDSPYSAILILQQSYPIEDDESMPILSEDGFQLISKPHAIAHNASKVVQTFASGSGPVESISPFILHLLYKSAVYFTDITTSQTDTIFHSPETVATMKQALLILNTKWRAAGTIQYSRGRCV